MGAIAGAAFLRAANAMLQTLGADSVTLLLPATATAGDAAGMIGLVDPGVQTVEISPVVVREIETGNLGPRRRIEFTMPASVIAAALPGLGIGTSEELFDAVLGLNYANDLFHVETAVPESFAGTVCFYVVTAVE